MRTNEENLDLFADLLEPTAAILGDKEIAAVARKGEPKVKLVKLAIKRHHKEVIELLAGLEGQDPESYVVPGPLALTAKLLKLVNNPDVQELFTLGPLTGGGSSGGPVTAHTQAAEQ